MFYFKHFAQTYITYNDEYNNKGIFLTSVLQLTIKRRFEKISLKCLINKEYVIYKDVKLNNIDKILEKGDL
jgi:hypothetical protein